MSAEKTKALDADNVRLIRRLLRESFPRHGLGYGVAILAMAIVAGMTTATAWLMKYTTDAVTGHRDLRVITMLSGAVAAVFIVKGLATYLQAVTLSRVGNSIVAERQLTTYRRVLEQGLAFYSNSSSADLITQVTQSAQAARDLVDTIVTSFARDALTLLGLAMVMLFQQPSLALVAAVIGPLIFLAINRLLKHVRRVMAQEYRSLSHIINVMQETVIGARVVKTFHLEKQMYGRMDQAVRDVQVRSNTIAALGAITHPMMETLAGVVIACAIFTSGVLIVKSGHTPGDITAFMAALLLAYEPAKRITNARIRIEGGLVGVRMMYQLSDSRIAVSELPDARPFEPGPGRIEFRNVDFGYDDKPVLRNFSRSFAPGKMTALVGPSGSGKSTIFNLIMRLYDPTAGAVLVDGQEIRQATFKSLRERIGYVGQETFLFSGSIMSNIRLGREGATDEEVIEAARRANADDFIMSLPKGYETEVGENGIRLSGGQRQRLSIARALLKDAQIMLFDEATSALDPESEGLFREALQRFSADRTTLVIAHRLSTIRRAHEIVVISDGAVAESGTHDALIESRGLYYRLHEKQFA